MIELTTVTCDRADLVYLPVLDNAVKASKLRSTLGVFEKSKFLFNLPGQLLESINAGKYDQALRDYKKGLFLHRGGALMPGVKATTPDQIARQRRIFNKVWDSVEDVMRDMRRRLHVLLKDPNRSIEDQEKTLEMLIEIEGSDEPAWSYLDYQHEHIVDSVKSLYERASDAVKRAQREAASEPSSSSPYTDLLRRQLAQPTYAPNAVTRELTVVARRTNISDGYGEGVGCHPQAYQAAVGLHRSLPARLLEGREGVHGRKVSQARLVGSAACLPSPSTGLPTDGRGHHQVVHRHPRPVLCFIGRRCVV